MDTFTTSRHFSAPPAAVFAAIRDPLRLARWWGPAGFTNHFESFDFRPGGRWVFTMHGPDGRSYANESVFARVEPDTRVVIRHTCAPLFTLTITLEASGGGTRLHWQQVLDDPDVAAAVAHIVEPANEQNLDRLGAELGLAGTPAA